MACATRVIGNMAKGDHSYKGVWIWLEGFEKRSFKKA